MNETTDALISYTAIIEHGRALDSISCRCEYCSWSGPAAELDHVRDAVLTPGDPSPAGRCPACSCLAYVDTPGVSDLTPALRNMIGLAEEAIERRKESDDPEDHELLDIYEHQLEQARALVDTLK